MVLGVYILRNNLSLGYHWIIRDGNACHSLLCRQRGLDCVPGDKERYGERRSQLANILPQIWAVRSMSLRYWRSGHRASRPTRGIFLPVVSLKHTRQLAVLLVQSQHNPAPTTASERCHGYTRDIKAQGSSVAFHISSHPSVECSSLLVFAFLSSTRKSPTSTYLRDLDRGLCRHTCFGSMTPLVPGEGLSRDSVDLLSGSHHSVCSWRNVAVFQEVPPLARCN